jgi:hypothetical protein
MENPMQTVSILSPEVSTLCEHNSHGWKQWLRLNPLYPRLALALCAVFILSAPARAAELPSAPAPTSSIVKQHVFGATDYALASGILAGRALDWASTQRAINRGGHEELLPGGLAKSKVGLGAFEAGMAVLEIYSAYELSRHGHRKLARTISALDITLSFAVDAHNLKVR